MRYRNLDTHYNYSADDELRFESAPELVWQPIISSWAYAVRFLGVELRDREIEGAELGAGTRVSPVITASDRTTPTSSEIISQGDHAMGTDAAREKYGFDGTGIKVGVISDSFDTIGGFEKDRANGELPNDTTILREGEWGIDEGRAMAQIIHDVAPGASIAFAAGGYTIETMAEAIRDLAASGAKVIVDDLSYQAEPTYQDSVINQAIRDVTAQGVTYVTMAGNNGNRGYGAPFKAASSSTIIDGKPVILHEFAPGQDYLSITIPSYTNIPFTFQWSDSYNSISPGKGAKTDLDLFFYNDRNEFLFKSGASNIGEDPIEQISYLTEGATETIHVKVGWVDGAPPEEFRLISLGNGRPIYFETLASNINPGTLYGHAASKDAIIVGAVNYRDTPSYGASQPWAEISSGVGTSSLTYDIHGNKLPAPDVLPGPAFMAPNDGDNTFFGWDSDGNGLPNFSGTSAAAPHAAALAALMLQANSALTSADIKNLLQNSAINMDDLNTPGFDKGYDSGTGAGFVQGTALGFAATGVIDNPFHKSLLLGTHLSDYIIGWGSQSMVSASDRILPNGETVDVTLYGYAGNDRLEGGAGNDFLDGGTGGDRMSGHGGNDRYVVDQFDDMVIEHANEGVDTVFAAISYTLPENVENLTLTGTDALSAIGNAHDNILIGNEAGNLIVGNEGNNTISGGDGDDTLIGGNGNDRIIGGKGKDQIHANGGSNYIDGGTGEDTITAGHGNDIIIGGGGNDVIYANGGNNLFQLGGIANALSDGDDQIWAGSGSDTYALYFEDADGRATGFGNDTINGFRLAENDQILIFNETPGYWHDPNALLELINDGSITGARSFDGGDLTLSFAGNQNLDSSLVLKWFFWDNTNFLSVDALRSEFGREIHAAALTGILLDIIKDGSTVGVHGSDYAAGSHRLVETGDFFA